MLAILMMLFTNPISASEHAFSGGIGSYYGDLGIAYTYSPILAVGFQAGVGTSGLSLGARWQPEWFSGGYAQAGLSRIGGAGYHPNMVVGGKWSLGYQSDWFMEANGGVAVSLGGQWWPIWDVGVGWGF